MKKRIFKGFILSIIAIFGSKSVCEAQNKPVYRASMSNDSAQLPESVAAFILPNYQVLMFKKGNLNKDSLDDILMVLGLKNERENGDALRPLLLIVQNQVGKYTLAARNDSIVACRACGGKFDPFADIAIKNGFFTIEHEGGSRERWTKDITFRFNMEQKTWFLHRIDETSFDTLRPKSETAKTRTTNDFGKISFVEYSFEPMF